MDSTPTTAYGYGLQTIARDGTVLDTWFPTPRLGEPPASFDPHILPQEISHQERSDDLLEVDKVGIGVRINLQSPPQSVPDAYLRLHLLSHTLVTPNSINLEGLFGVLHIAAFTNRGPIHPHTLNTKRAALQAEGVQVTGVDKFPPLTNYHTPQGVRIADTSRVRLGAHLAAGTTVMHEGFVNFNAGTLGASMVEGRISQGVIVGAGSDIGGGASIMGTLSGGGTEVISLGERCLLGANAGIGISLGDDCVVEAGLYVTAGTKVTVLADGGAQVRKAGALSGVSGLLFRRNSQSGIVEVLPREGAGVSLNEALHA